MSKKVVDLQWHIVSGNMEVDLLKESNKIKPWQPSSDRHSLFLKIKYPEHDFYKGSWGPEILHVVNEGYERGTVGKVWCSYSRYLAIQRWFLSETF